MLSRSPASAGLGHGPVTLRQTMNVISGLLGDSNILFKLARLGGAPEDERHPIVLDAFVKQFAKGILSEEMRIQGAGPGQTYPPYLLNALEAQGLNNPAGRLQARVVAAANDLSLPEVVMGKEPAEAATAIADLHTALASGKADVAKVRELLQKIDHAEVSLGKAWVDQHIDLIFGPEANQFKELREAFDLHMGYVGQYQAARPHPSPEQIRIDYHNALLKGDPKAVADAKAALADLPLSALNSDVTQRIEAAYRPQIERTFREGLAALDYAEDLQSLRAIAAKLDLLRQELPQLTAQWEATFLRSLKPTPPMPVIDLLKGGRSIRDKRQEEARKLIKHADDPILHNREITSFYADQFLKDPIAFRWAGMAAYASNTVGAAMVLYQPYDLISAITYPMPNELLEDSPELMEHLRSTLSEPLFGALAEGNRLIFDDIGWQHLAYYEGGIDEIRAAFFQGDISSEVWLGWELIDEGKELVLRGQSLGDDEMIRRGNDIVWEGTEALLRFEQEVVLAKMYEPTRKLWGGIHMQLLYPPIPGDGALFGQVAPFSNIADFEPRWWWIEWVILPMWKERVEKSPKEVLDDMTKFRNQPIVHPAYVYPAWEGGRTGHFVLRVRLPATKE